MGVRIYPVLEKNTDYNLCRFWGGSPIACVTIKLLRHLEYNCSRLGGLWNRITKEPDGFGYSIYRLRGKLGLDQLDSNLVFGWGKFSHYETLVDEEHSYVGEYNLEKGLMLLEYNGVNLTETQRRMLKGVCWG